MLRAGINKASHLVVVNRETADKSCGGEETLADSETIIAVQTVFRMFPNANIITELSQASNMRFMQFSAQDIYLQKVSKLEQVQSINIVIITVFSRVTSRTFFSQTHYARCQKYCMLQNIKFKGNCLV